ncbi:MAG: selenium-dependent molybdenum cofactor biosynthesis protein YqeB [Pleomorphochaeta sp.]
MKNNNLSPYKIAYELESKNIPFAWVSLCDHKGVVTRTSGRMLVKNDGQYYGTIGGGLVEYKAIEKAKEALKVQKGGLFTIYRDDENKDNYIKISIDVGESSSKMIIIGGGHVGKSVAQIASQSGFEIEIIETREEFTKPEDFPMASNIYLSSNITKTLNEINTNNSAILVLNNSLLSTEDYQCALKSNAWYVGIMTSNQHMYSLIENIDINSEENLKLHCPIGLNTGGQTPYQVGLSIVCEVLGEKNNKSLEKRNTIFRPIIVRGAGDLATGTILKLHRAGFKVIALEVEEPTVIRRTVSFAQAMFDNQYTVEDTTAIKCDKDNIDLIYKTLTDGKVVVVSDKDATLIKKIKPLIVVDAILAKKNLGTKITDAPLVIALGPGFEVNKDCHCIIETKRGHYVGNVLYKGQAIANSGIPGIIGGYGKERVIHSPVAGTWYNLSKIGDIVKQGDIIAKVDETLIEATIDGKIRGLLTEGIKVPKGFKVADIDPRGEEADHTTVSDKGRNIAGGVLSAIYKFLYK